MLRQKSGRGACFIPNAAHVIIISSTLRQKSGKPPVSRTRGRVHMEHIRLPHASMCIRLCSMLTFAFAYIIFSSLRCFLRIRSSAGTSNMNPLGFIIAYLHQCRKLPSLPPLFFFFQIAVADGLSVRLFDAQSAAFHRIIHFAPRLFHMPDGLLGGVSVPVCSAARHQ